MFFYKNNQNVYWSENADVVFAYACALDALPRNPLQGRALINLKWATDLGHAKAKEYHKAFDYYLLAKNSLGEEHPESVKELSKYLLWMKLHIDSFSYSEEMEEYYLKYTQAPEFSKAFLNSEIKLSIANIVISLHYGKIEEAKQSLEIAKEICKPNYKGRLHNILYRHKCNETLNITPEAIAFINNLKI